MKTYKIALTEEELKAVILHHAKNIDVANFHHGVRSRLL